MKLGGGLAKTQTCSHLRFGYVKKKSDKNPTWESALRVYLLTLLQLGEGKTEQGESVTQGGGVAEGEAIGLGFIRLSHLL
ncbi:hypothetical protein GDO81_012520 [Engystomops pustulosus]|uniref:Uncharacterized protein n=1 Tax=Engystomops pustulosus TaxID=76066 RepID=A0AAV7BM81_ENGPU|nr:hypothetical protein GDO81_012520 [Engystomops pustulosus]